MSRSIKKGPFVHASLEKKIAIFRNANHHYRLPGPHNPQLGVRDVLLDSRQGTIGSHRQGIDDTGRTFHLAVPAVDARTLLRHHSKNRALEKNSRTRVRLYSPSKHYGGLLQIIILLLVGLTWF